ncbi:hypothetical protein C450_13867 [Halococcus salifodinae DSM 8989]|uniref:Uncharacterized protein n=1 Tax=Halococcus salifodinae DSM 8989 TaxID=1227456 RepID=M0MZP2_9EURY|nr:hypothetical protein C450_13867 [Halococcus salifodinae DSM 8989]
MWGLSVRAKRARLTASEREVVRNGDSEALRASNRWRGFAAPRSRFVMPKIAERFSGHANERVFFMSS